MKNKKSVKWVIAFFVIGIIAFSQNSFAQKRLPDGTIIYSDGSVRLPNGTMKYPTNKNTTNNGTRLPDGTVINPNGTNYPSYPNVRYPRRATRQSDGSIIYPDGRIVYPDGTVRYPDGTVSYPNSGNGNNNRGWIPPGQRKKMYGNRNERGYGNGRREGNHDDDEEDDRNNDNGRKYKGHGKHNKDD